METPSSTRRVTRSQTAAASASNNNTILISKRFEDSEQGLSKSRHRNSGKLPHQEATTKSALIDITNNSPIVGLAMGSLQTPSSSIPKKSNRGKITPGSGEALLRGQVKSLLQKVEEEAELSKISLESRPVFPHLHGFISSPMGLLAPTPANTPQVFGLSDGQQSTKDGLTAPVASPDADKSLISQPVTDILDGQKQESLESQKSPITRFLLWDFSDKSEVTDESECSSELTAEGESVEGKEKTDEDGASVWSIQVNASTHDEDEEDFEDTVDETENYGEDEVEEEEDGGLVDELCLGLEKMSIMAKFEGKHTRFVYNSDEDEIVAGEEEKEERASCSPNTLRLKGLPTPKGKHIRFAVEDKAED